MRILWEQTRPGRGWEGRFLQGIMTCVLPSKFPADHVTYASLLDLPTSNQHSCVIHLIAHLSWVMVAMSNYQDGFISAFKSPNLVSDMLPLRLPFFSVVNHSTFFPKISDYFKK